MNWISIIAKHHGQSISALLSGLLLSSSVIASLPDDPTNKNTHENSERPNIILILADDLGIENLGIYGGESYQTPNLDQLANDGLRFENAHSSPLCTPSRVKIMTGKYNFRNYQDFMVLPKGETTFGHALRDAGYRTMIAGKWQLHDSGFESEAGMMPEESGFEDHRLWQVTREERGSRYWGPTLVTNGKAKTYPEDQFGPDLINRFVLDYIEQQQAQQQPFFIYYPMLLPHDPFVSTPDHPRAESNEEKFAAMMAYMDKLVGQVRTQLDTLGIAENTIVMFIGDNGTTYRLNSVRNGQTIQGGKGKTTDNGTHVPFITWWKGKIEAGRIDHSLIDLNDFFPTLLDLAGISDHADYSLDGMSLIPVLYNEQTLDRSSVFIHYDPKTILFKSARYAFDAEWKLYDDGRFYHTASDPEESQNLSQQPLDNRMKQAKAKLQRHLDTAGGESVSGFYSLPDSFVTRLQRAAVLAALTITLIFYWWRRRRPTSNH